MPGARPGSSFKRLLSTAACESACHVKNWHRATAASAWPDQTAPAASLVAVRDPPDAPLFGIRHIKRAVRTHRRAHRAILGLGGTAVARCETGKAIGEHHWRAGFAILVEGQKGD